MKIANYLSLLIHIDVCMTLKSLLEGKDYFYIMHLSYGKDITAKAKASSDERLWNYAKDKGFIGLSHHTVEGNWNENKVKESAKEKGISPYWEKQFDMFYEVKTGDIMMILLGMKYILGVAKVENKPTKFKKELGGRGEGFFQHIRKVNWNMEYTYTFDKRRPLRKQVTFYNTLRRVKQDTKWGRETWTNLVNIKLPD